MKLWKIKGQTEDNKAITDRDRVEESQKGREMEENGELEKGVEETE